MLSKRCKIYVTYKYVGESKCRSDFHLGWKIANSGAVQQLGYCHKIYQAHVLLNFSVQRQDTAVDGLITLPSMINTLAP